MTHPTTQRADLHATRLAIDNGHTSAAQEMALSLALAQSSSCQHAFLSLDPHGANAAARAVQPGQALAGLAVSVKDLFDVVDQVTAAGSTVLANSSPAAVDCPAVARLKSAGGAVLGRTNMVEFAFSGVGCNPHYGTPANPCDTLLARIPGGSSSGAAVSVASGAAFIGLGSDTGGSLRIPAALCGIVGFKPTARTVPTNGTVPLSTTLDTVGALTRSVRDAVTAHEVLSAAAVPRALPDLRKLKLAVAHITMLDGLEPVVAQAFEHTLRLLRAAGAQIEDIKLPEIADLGSIQSRGGFSAPEAQAWQRARGLWPDRKGEYDSRVAQRIAMADNMSASDYVALHTARQDWIQRTSRALGPYAAVLSPTVPITAPPIASLAPAAGQDTQQDAQQAVQHAALRDTEFWRVNGLLLRNPSVVNLLDGCAISLPCQLPGQLPVGLMLWHGAMHDNTILQLALWVEAQLAQSLQK
jgi:aspartyl-tRNA(Asn)/glutamyl-tRNA(Gln) amidotransferase subunit A